MTTISNSTTIGITLTSPAYVNPIVINPGVTVYGGNGVFASTGSWTIQDNGGISGAVDGIYLMGGADTIVNSGTIAGADGDGVEITGGAGTVVNSGTIAGAGDVGVLLGAGGSVNNAASASITGRYWSVEVTNSVGTVVNSGTIGGGYYSYFRGPGGGVYLGAGGSVTNAASASITGRTWGVEVTSNTGTVVNSGTVGGGSVYSGYYHLGFYGGGVYLGAGGSVTNAASASITGVYAGVEITGAAGTVVNSGTIAGDLTGVLLGAGGTVTNAGTITGYHGIAVDFSGTVDNRLVVDPGAVFNGAVSGSTSGSNTLELASGGTGTLSGLGTNFVNFETVTVDSGASWNLTGSNALSAGQTLVDNGTLSGNLIVSSGGIMGDGRQHGDWHHGVQRRHPIRRRDCQRHHAVGRHRECLRDRYVGDGGQRWRPDRIHRRDRFGRHGVEWRHPVR
jgi:hypothetical protein